MAQNDAPQTDINEVVRQRLRAFVRSLLLVIPLIGLIVALYMAFGGSDPRKELKSVPLTLEDYSRFISSYIGVTPVRPDNFAIDKFLGYFDETSRKFFDKNADTLAKQRLEFDKEAFDKMDKGSRRAEAMLALVSRPPLNGFGAIRNQRHVNPTEVEIIVDTRSNTPVTIRLQQKGDLYYIKDFGGLKASLERELGSQGNTTP